MSKNDPAVLNMRLSQQRRQIDSLQIKVDEIWAIITNSPMHNEQKEAIREIAYKIVDNHPKEDFIRAHGKENETNRHRVVDELVNSLCGDLSKMLKLAEQQLEKLNAKIHTD